MRIAQVVSLIESVPPRAKNGLEFVVSWITEELVKRGHEVTLFAPADSQTSARLVPLLPKGFSSDFRGIGHYNGTQWDIHFFNMWNTVLTGMKEGEFDIIHCHNGNAAYLAPFVGVPVVETIHNTYDDAPRTAYLSHPEYKNLLEPVLKQYEKVNFVTVSERQRDFFKACEPYYFKKHTNIHNGIPVERFSYNGEPGKYLFYIGYINADKGADIAVQIVRRTGMKLKIAGHAGDGEFFKKHIEPYLNEDIQYLGPVDFDQKVELYRNATAVISPFRWHEPFGLTTVEAQACGTPVIAFDKGAARETIDHGVTGFVVQNEDEMVEAVKKIGTIERAQCREWVEQNFSVEKMVDGYEALYTKLSKK